MAPAESFQAIQAKKVMGIVLYGVENGMASKYYYYSNVAPVRKIAANSPELRAKSQKRKIKS